MDSRIISERIGIVRKRETGLRLAKALDDRFGVNTGVNRDTGVVTIHCRLEEGLHKDTIEGAMLYLEAWNEALSI